MWGNGLVGYFQRAEHRLGNLPSDEDNIVWGTLDEDNIVWGTSANQVSVLGTLERGSPMIQHGYETRPGTRRIRTRAKRASHDCELAQRPSGAQGRRGYPPRTPAVGCAVAAGLLNTEEVTRFISPPPTTLAGFERFIEWTHRERAAGNYVCFGIVPDGYDQAVGLFQVRS